MVVATLFSFHHLGEWAYWLPLMAMLAVGLACGWPGRDAFGPAGGSDPADAEDGDRKDPVPV